MWIAWRHGRPHSRTRRQEVDVDYVAAVHRGFRDAPFIEHLGVKLEALGPGWCEASLVLQPWQYQQTGVAHAGVVGTLADHCAGAAAATTLRDGEFVVSAEYKINFLSGAQGERLVCRGEVLKPGRRLIVVEADVWAERAGERQRVARLNATMAVVASAK
jgi:uncharacterized protein (TIGR00369 family)